MHVFLRSFEKRHLIRRFRGISRVFILPAPHNVGKALRCLCRPGSEWRWDGRTRGTREFSRMVRSCRRTPFLTACRTMDAASGESLNERPMLTLCVRWASQSGALGMHLKWCHQHPVVNFIDRCLGLMAQLLRNGSIEKSRSTFGSEARSIKEVGVQPVCAATSICASEG